MTRSQSGNRKKIHRLVSSANELAMMTTKQQQQQQHMIRSTGRPCIASLAVAISCCLCYCFLLDGIAAFSFQWITKTSSSRSWNGICNNYRTESNIRNQKQIQKKQHQQQQKQQQQQQQQLQILHMRRKGSLLGETVYSPNVDMQPVDASDSSRRKSFGAMVGSILLPTMVGTTQPVDAASTSTLPVLDDYPFKKTVKKLAEAFPEAVTNTDLIKKVTKSLGKYKYDDSTLVAFSLCADEVNRPLEDTFYGWFGEHFNMGGLAGFPFAGVTGFGAMAAHIPDGGSCLLVYGPHVGIDLDGNVGKINRKGKGKAGSCCGSAVAASKYITAVYEGRAEQVGPPTDSVDAQQNYVSAALLPYGEAVSKAKDPMVELPFATYEPIDEMMQRIVNKAGKGVKDGKIAMLGGIQINTPRGMSDYFLPLRFDIRNSSGELIENLMWTRKVGSETRSRVA